MIAKKKIKETVNNMSIQAMQEPSVGAADRKKHEQCLAAQKETPQLLV